MPDLPRRRYPTDLTAAQWRRVEPLLPPQFPRGRPRHCDLREIVNAIHYRWSTGCSWRMLPHDLPPWGTVYWYFREWHRAGRLATLRTALLARSSTIRRQHPPVQEAVSVST